MVFFHLPGSRVEAIELLPFPDADCKKQVQYCEHELLFFRAFNAHILQVEAGVINDYIKEASEVTVVAFRFGYSSLLSTLDVVHVTFEKREVGRAGQGYALDDNPKGFQPVCWQVCVRFSNFVGERGIMLLSLETQKSTEISAQILRPLRSPSGHLCGGVANGDIIGAGYAWTDIGYCGWMIRVTADAELVWERYIQDNRLAANVYTEFRDVTECLDGSIAAAGLWVTDESPRDGGIGPRSWVVKLDANGCLEPNGTSDTIHLMRPVANEEIVREPTPTIKINPNPVAENLHLEISGLNAPVSRLRYTIASSDGRIL
jgi:hypothetical protein